jgi:hypothetical protein
MMHTPDEYLDAKLTRRFFGAIVARAVYDYRGNDAARSAEAGAWLDEIAGNSDWRDALAERGRPRKVG